MIALFKIDRFLESDRVYDDLIGLWSKGVFIIDFDLEQAPEIYFVKQIRL